MIINMMTTKSRIAPTTAVGTAMAIVRSRALSPTEALGVIASDVGVVGIPVSVRKTCIL